MQRDNPWELLAFALLLFAGGLDMVVQRDPMAAAPNVGRGRRFGEALSPEGAHIVGWCAIVIAVLITALFFYVRWSSSAVSKGNE
jgi:hypothetical protein